MSHVLKRRKPDKVSHRWKRESLADFTTKRMAKLIDNQNQLHLILAQTNPKLRDACFARLEPYLTFKAVNPFAATPQEERPS